MIKMLEKVYVGVIVALVMLATAIVITDSIILYYIGAAMIFATIVFTLITTFVISKDGAV